MSNYQIPLGATAQNLQRTLAPSFIAPQNPAANTQLAELRIPGRALRLEYKGRNWTFVEAL
jgi:hypothetical protein